MVAAFAVLLKTSVVSVATNIIAGSQMARKNYIILSMKMLEGIGMPVA